MSLETVIEQNTATLERLIAVLQSGSGLVTTTSAPVFEAVKPSRSKKTDPAAAQLELVLPVVTPVVPAVASVAVPAVAYVEDAAAFSINTGDAPGTRYFHIPLHNTVYKQSPGDIDCTLAGALEVSGLEYLAEKAALAKKFPTAIAPDVKVAPVVIAPTEPTVTASVDIASGTPEFADVVAKFKALHQAQGNPGLLEILNQFGAAKVPALAADASKFAAIIAAIDAKLMGL